MKFKDFKQEYDGAPIELDELAYAAARVKDSPDLRHAAEQFISARANFLNELNEKDIVIG